MKWLAALLIAVPLASAAAEFTDELERDFSLRSIGHLRITNLRGPISIQGWALDKIRVKAVRKATADTEEEGKKLLSALDVRYRAIDRDVEISAEYGRGLEIHEKLREREHPKTGMELSIMAPSHLKLRVWAVDHEVAVKSWSGDEIEIRTTTGPIRAESIRADEVSLQCPDCVIQAREIHGGLRCVGGSKEIRISDATVGPIYVETTSGPQTLERIQGEQLYVSRSGSVSGRDLSGRVEFSTEDGGVEIEGRGFASGHTSSGNISLDMKEWRFLDKGLIESRKGNVKLSLPPSFAGEVDLWSVLGKTELAFPLKPLVDERVYGPDPANRLRGWVSADGELLRVFSETGDIQVLKGI